MIPNRRVEAMVAVFRELSTVKDTCIGTLMDYTEGFAPEDVRSAVVTLVSKGLVVRCWGTPGLGRGTFVGLRPARPPIVVEREQMSVPQRAFSCAACGCVIPAATPMVRMVFRLDGDPEDYPGVVFLHVCCEEGFMNDPLRYLRTLLGGVQ